MPSPASCCGSTMARQAEAVKAARAITTSAWRSHAPVVDVDVSPMPSRIVCDGRPRRLGGGREGEDEAWERELVGVRGESSVAGQVEQEEGGGEASEEEGGASGEAEGARGEQGQEMDEDGEPDGELDGVL